MELPQMLNMNNNQPKNKMKPSNNHQIYYKYYKYHKKGCAVFSVNEKNPTK